jgi:hypothetical protein
MHPLPPTTAQDPAPLLTESELAAWLKTTVASVRWMRRTGRLSYLKIAGNRKVRFDRGQVLEDLRATEIRAHVHTDKQARRLTRRPTTDGGSSAHSENPATNLH